MGYEKMAQVAPIPVTNFASQQDYAECERLHRKFGTTYYFATKRFPKETQRHTHAVYGFVRVPDEWVDNPGSLTPEDQMTLLKDWRSQLRLGTEGICPNHPVMRAFVDTVTQTNVSPCEAAVFISAMEMDLATSRYESYSELEQYMRGSAAAVGIMMLQILAPHQTVDQYCAAKTLGDAMQMTNFLRDIDEDFHTRNRIYIPLEDLAKHNVDPEQIANRHFDKNFGNLMEFQVARTRALYSAADPGIATLPTEAQQAVLLARILYSKILDKLEEQNLNPFLKRARTSKFEKLNAAIQVAARPQQVLEKLQSK